MPIRSCAGAPRGSSSRCRRPGHPRRRIEDRGYVVQTGVLTLVAVAVPPTLMIATVVLERLERHLLGSVHPCTASRPAELPGTPQRADRSAPRRSLGSVSGGHADIPG